MDSKPDISIYLRLLYGGGAERVMVNLMHGFVKRGLKVELVVNTVAGPYLDQVPPQVRIVSLDAPRMIHGLPKLANYLRQRKPKVLLSALHYNNEVALWAKILSFDSPRVVVSERNTLSVHAKARKTDKWSPLLAKLFYPFADNIIAVSNGVAEDLIKVTGIKSKKIEVIYNPVDEQRLLEKSKETVDHPWFQLESTPVILGVGRLEEQKDFPTLIRAFSKVRKQYKSKLVILGSGSNRKRLETLVDDLNLGEDVDFLGFASNPYAYMARASVFVLSSLWEGLPNVLIEAMFLKTPVVATDCPSGPRELLDNGKYGKLVPMSDDESMGQAILESLTSSAVLADRKWLEKFSLDSAVSSYLKALKVS